MSNAHRPLWALALIAIATCGGERETDLVSIELEVPAETSRRAKARGAGDAAAPTPVLLLEDVELGSGERLSLQLVDRMPTPPKMLGSSVRPPPSVREMAPMGRRSSRRRS
ncbi:MAG: hypothetical protein HC897_15740 [Thermoanaerobaculia bacterium]|nr:hypothetical protein [Thermoanaerobaculia bacterium]